ncbi:extracellular solute-binding protein [Lacticaseibacillus camelliae]|uniref:sugar ABC transporter substrate-binding protein n=1 Tax=Lacticaseibacillus camelliae TaxID=381742 RepID=UPI000AE3A1CC|nr:extracellular solute-binding protein [Lacticaseibacillus camelliae]
MKLFTKRTVLGAATALASLSLVACGSSQSTAGDSTTDFKGQELKIGIWLGSDAEKAGMKDMVDGFEKETGAKVTEKVYTDFNTQIQADLSGHRAPDVWYMDSSMYPFFQSQGVLEPLDKEDLLADKFYPTLTKAYTTDGKLYGVPKDTSTLGLYVNKEMLTKTNTAIEDVPKSYEDMIDWLPGFQAKLDEPTARARSTPWRTTRTWHATCTSCSATAASQSRKTATPTWPQTRS